MTPLRVGLVCPYSFDAPGGVQAHVVDLARRLRALGHHAEVLAPAEPGTDLPDVVTAAGGSVAVPYNGSVARLAFTPRSAAQVRRWLEAGDFDVLHLHEPVVPSLALQTLWLADGPIVATFHFSMERSRALQVAAPVLCSSMYPRMCSWRWWSRVRPCIWSMSLPLCATWRWPRRVACWRRPSGRFCTSAAVSHWPMRWMSCVPSLPRPAFRPSPRSRGLGLWIRPHQAFWECSACMAPRRRT